MKVRRLAIAPVKGLALVHPEAVTLGRSGVQGDRRFYLVDPDGRLVNNKTCGELMRVQSGGEQRREPALAPLSGRRDGRRRSRARRAGGDELLRSPGQGPGR